MSSNEDHILLLNLIREGDKLAFRHLFESYFTPLCRFMHLYIRETTIVEELALDILPMCGKTGKHSRYSCR